MSVFLEVPEAAWGCANELAFAFRDRLPVSPGHALIVTQRVTADWFSATVDEQRAVLSLVVEAKRQLGEELVPDGCQRRVQCRRGGGPDGDAPARPRDQCAPGGSA